MTDETDSNTMSCPPSAAGRRWLISFQASMATQLQRKPIMSATQRKRIGSAPKVPWETSMKPSGQAAMTKRSTATGRTVTP